MGNLESVFELDDDDDDDDENEDNKADDEEDCGMAGEVELFVVKVLCCLRWDDDDDGNDELLTTVKADVVGDVSFLKLGKSSAENTDLDPVDGFVIAAECLLESLIDVDEQLDAELDARDKRPVCC